MTTRSGPLLAALSTWLLPFAVAAAGIGVHFALHVPNIPLPPPSAQKLEEDKKAAEKKKKEEDRKKREEDRKAGKHSKPDKPGAKDFPYEPFTTPRKQFILDQLHAYYEPEDFKKEPTFDAWQTAHKSLIAQIVHGARAVGLAEAPPINVVGSECHTIRCRFTLTGADAAAIEQLTAVLRTLELGGGPLWHTFTADAATPDKKDSAGRFKAQLTVSFTRDLPALAAIQVPGKGTLVPQSAAKPSTPKPATTPATPPSPKPPRTGPTTPGAAPSGMNTPSDAPVRSG